MSLPCPGCGRDRGRCPLQRSRGLVAVPHAQAIEVAGTLPLLDEAIAVTESIVSTLAHEGRYDRPSVCGDRFSVRPGRIALRLAPDRVRGAVTDDDVPSGPAEASVVGLVDRRGGSLHRTFVTGTPDRMIVRALGHLDPADEYREMLFGYAESTRRRDCARLSEISVPSGIDEVLIDNGRMRLARLCELDETRYRPIPADVVPGIFEFLCDSGIPTGFAVFTGGLMQACYGQIHAALREGPTLLTGFADAAIDIDLARIDTCAVVRCSSGGEASSAIELYDAAGNCAAMLSQFDSATESVHAEWEAMAQSLCTAI